MKVIIAGGRDFDSVNTMSLFCDKILGRLQFDAVEIVSGGAPGADTLAKNYSKIRGYPFKEFSADWNQYGKSAGPIRNKQMAEYADGLIAFWDGKSPGTKNMIDTARELGLKVRVKKY